jgi:hypothetical protein
MLALLGEGPSEIFAALARTQDYEIILLRFGYFHDGGPPAPWFSFFVPEFCES